MQFALTGANQGKSLKLGGFHFRGGLADIPDDSPDAHNLLRNFYEAYPVHLLEEKDGRLVQRETGANIRLETVKELTAAEIKAAAKAAAKASARE